ncbi:hypothetical protein [Vreelandella sp. EE27]
MSDESNMPPDEQQRARHTQARHAGNAEARWIALTSFPDFCQVGDKIIGFDSSAPLGNPVNYSPNVITAGQRTYRVGDLSQGTQGNDGSGVESGTSQGRGHVLFLTGQDNVRANGQPVVIDGSEAMINCNAAGIGGAKGYVHTNTQVVNSQPEATSEPLSVAEQLQQQAQANLEHADELRDALNENPTGKTAAEAQILQTQVEALDQSVQRQMEAAREAYHNGSLTGDELHDLMEDTNEAAINVLDLQENAVRQVGRANTKGTAIDFIIGFNPIIGAAQLLEEVGDGVRSGQYGQAAVPVLLEASPIGRALGSAANKVLGRFKKSEGIERGTANQASNTPNNQQNPIQDNNGLRVEQNSTNMGGSSSGELNTKETRTNFNNYEVLSEMPISGTSRPAHRSSANSRYADLLTDSQFRQMTDDILGTDVLRHMQSGSGAALRNPPGTEWHHPFENPRVMQLLRRTEHRNPLLQDVLHPGPNRQGGFGRHFGGSK